MWGFGHVESKCGHVSMELLGHSAHFGFGCKLGEKIFLWWIPIYWAYQNFGVFVLWVFVILRYFPKLVEEFVVDLIVGMIVASLS